MFEKLPNSIRTVYFKTIRRAAELLEQSEVVECGTDEDKLRIELLAVCLPSSFAQKKTRCEWLKSSGVLNSRSRPVASRVS